MFLKIHQVSYNLYLQNTMKIGS